MAMNSLIDKKKKAEVLQRIRDRKAPFCAEKPLPEKPAGPMQTATNGKTRSLNKAIKSKDWSIPEIRRLIAEGADINARAFGRGIDAQNTPLMTAVYFKRNEIFDLLIGLGAEINKTNGEGETPLIIAAREDNKYAARILLDRGADVNVQPKCVLTKIPEGAALHYAVRNNDPELVQMLLERGADVTKRAWRDKKTSLMIAIEHRKFLIDNPNTAKVEELLRAAGATE